MKLEALRLLASLRLEPRRVRFLSGFIDTYLRLNPRETLLFNAQADTLLTRKEKTKVMELTTSWKEEGLRQGRQEGRRQVVLRLLHRRCGSLPRAIESKVRLLPAASLENLAEAVLDFSALADLERWLEEH